VPIERKRGAIELSGMMNDAVPIRFALDTGASITNIPYDLAKRLGARVIREQKFELADGTFVTNQVILIRKLSIGGQVTVDGIEASVSESGTMPLLGKNFLDSFSSYEINNAQSQLICASNAIPPSTAVPSRKGKHTMATYEQPQPAATPAPRGNMLFGGIVIGLSIAFAAFAVFTAGFDRCLSLKGGDRLGNLETRSTLVCGFRL
jgi:clan AA aspartic protease (TIGR02281 family)